MQLTLYPSSESLTSKKFEGFEFKLSKMKSALPKGHVASNQK